MGITYFFDTYAFYEIIKGNPAYDSYKKDILIITTRLNLMELHYGLLLLYDKEIADHYYDKFIQFIVELTDDIIKQANIFRLTHRKRKLSYVDCIGYIIAKLRNVKFLTGDKQFENLDNVEYVK